MPALPRYFWMIAGLVLTRLIGWGSTYYIPSVLGGAFQRDLGMRSEIVFAGISVMLVISAFVAPAAGRYFEIHGTRGAMVTGSLMTAIGLGLLSLSIGPLTYLAAWVVIGLSSALTLQNASNVAVAQMMGDRTRHVIGVMMLFTGLSATLFWPLAEYLEHLVGWRQTCLIFAGMHLLCAAIHGFLPRGTAHSPAPAATEASRMALEGRMPLDNRRLAFWLVATSFSLNGLVSWGLPLHLIGLFEGGGLNAGTAVLVASLVGPAQIAARLFELVTADRIGIEKTSLFALGVLPFACLILVVFGVSTVTTLVFALVYGASSGVLAMARATLPLMLFGRRSYSTMLGRLTVPQNLVFAAAPLLFAFAIEWLGAMNALVIASGLQLAAFFAMQLLVRRL